MQITLSPFARLIQWRQDATCLGNLAKFNKIKRCELDASSCSLIMS